MSRQMQQSAPAHLKQYVNPDKPVYVPQHVQQQLDRHMQQSMPGHLKGYSGAFLQQKIVQPGLTGVASQGPRPVAPVAPNPNQLRQDHSNVNAGQYNASFYGNMFAADQSNQPEQPAYPPQQPNLPPQPGQPAPPEPAQPYDFIMNGDQPQANKSRIPGVPKNASLPQKLLIGLGALLALIIIFSVVRGIFGGSSDMTAYVGVAQDQQQLIHLLTPEKPDQLLTLSANNQNFVATASLTIASSQQKLINYLTKNGQKVDAKQLALGVNPQNDQQLTAAAAAGTYDTTFQEVMESELNQYINGLNSTYNQASGKNGRALLSDQYCQAVLLLKQLNPAKAPKACETQPATN